LGAIPPQHRANPPTKFTNNQHSGPGAGKKYGILRCAGKIKKGGWGGSRSCRSISVVGVSLTKTRGRASQKGKVENERLSVIATITGNNAPPHPNARAETQNQTTVESP